MLILITQQYILEVVKDQKADYTKECKIRDIYRRLDCIRITGKKELGGKVPEGKFSKLRPYN